ncbi:Protein MLP1-like protein [Cladobotryum mycophilum]|uniref:Protein MLP1-like protein n=1 Tax=Cladobotryum mycophilum TaxID=491253 RepID=A0ABR0SXD1_9HYPO
MADVDVGYISGHLGLDQPVLISLATEPTADLVSTLLQAVAAKAQEFEALYADKLQIDIELENAVRSSETKSQTFKATADKALKDVEEARQRLKEEETKRQSGENELQVLKAKYSDHDAEVKALNDKIETLQSSNRTNLGIIESNNKQNQTLTEELTKQHQRNVEISRELTALQQSEQNAKGQLNSAKFRQESLQQQLDLARQNTEWLENELKTKSDEALKYRKEKGARIAELQRQNEDFKSQFDALKRTEQQLRDRLDAMQTKTDDALVKLQKQEGSFASTVDSYKQELEDQRRLVDMSNQLSKKHQQRVQELDAEKERLKDNYENELRRVRLELESERRVTVDMEERIRHLETELDETQARMEHAPVASSTPQTPRPNGSFMARAASPFATPGSVRSKSAITATQAIEQLYQVKGQLASERRRNQQLSEELDNMMTALEAKAPEMQELQSEAETLRTEIARMSELSQQSFEERDGARKVARKAESALATAQSETQILRTQLRDLGTQIQMLVFNLYAIEKGVDQLTEEETFRLKQLEKGEITEEALSDMSDTHQFITQKLVVFKDIKSLQAKNEDLLRITRELAEQLESEEALAAKHRAKEDHDMVERLQLDLTHMTEEIKSAKITMESYKMERDMFRRLLQQRGVAGDEASMMRSSLDGRHPLASIESGEQTETLGEALRKLQSEYDGFRDAQDGARKDFRDQIDHLTTEKNSLQTSNIKLQGEARLEFERREMLQSNYVALQQENSELQKRSQILSETAAKQDIRTQQVAEELIETKGLLDSMRNETANLKAEKKLWKDIQERMGKDNDSLIEEKNRLGNLLAAQQSLENERNITESETRRKSQSKIEQLEHELSAAQKKLSHAVEEGQHLQQRKEYEAKEAQKRIDDLMASLSQIREEHISAKTSRDHLQARVDELTVELRNAEERVGRLQPRPTPRPGLGGENTQRLQELEAEIQDLNNDISDLKRDLDLANTQLENAKAQAEQYKELSQSNEEALEDLRASQDQYRQEIDCLIQEKDTKIRHLGQQIEDVSSELSRSNTELSALRDSQGEIARKYEDEKTILEDEVKRLKDESNRHMEAARYHQQDLRAQAEIASKAQQDYEKELVKHAEAAKLVQQLRTEYNEMKSESASLRADAESAKATLTQSESSWEDRRQHLEQEMVELKQRREDANAQNKLLHQQLESLTAQVAALQQNRSDNTEGYEAMSPIQVGDAMEGMRELNSYLRREKEILEVQYDMKLQEAKRLQQQVEYMQSQLDETRLKLDQERSSASQSSSTSMAHQDLMEKLNELNLYRESSMALRSENGQLKDQISEKNKKIDEMAERIQPLESEIDNLNTQKSFLEDEIKQIQEDRDRWQKRTEGILTKYGRVDPAEMEDLKKTISDLEMERNTLRQGEQPLKEKITELEATLETERTNWTTTRGKLTEQFKERSRKITGERNEALQRSNTLQEQLDKSKNDLVGVQRQVEQSGQERTELQRQIQNFHQQVEELRRQAQQAQPAPPTVPTSQPTEASPSSEVVTVLEQHLANARKELEMVNAQKLGAEQQLETLRGELHAAVSERDDALQKLQTISTTNATDGQSMPAVDAMETQTHAATSALSDEEKKALEEKIAAAEAKASEFEQKANEVEAKIQQTIKERSDRMRDTLNNKLKESRSKLEEEYKQKDADLKLRFEQEKLIWKAELGPPPATPAAEAPATEQPPSTPAKTEQQSIPSTPATTGQADLSQMDDGSIRQFLASNATVKSIISANLRKKLEMETTKLKSEYEGKISAAREQAQLMESKKSTLRINMAENKLRSANAKLGVVETAATETPQKPVVEVWNVAKSAQAPAPTPAAPKATPARQPSNTGMPSTPAVPFAAAAASPAPNNTPKQTTAPPTANDSKPADATQPPAPSVGGMPAPKTSNPFAVSVNTSAPEATNPFAPKSEANQPPEVQTAQPQQSQPQPQPQQQQPQQQQQQQPQQPQQPQQSQQPGQPGQLPGRSSIPMPRGGGRGRGGAYVPPSQRTTGGHQEAGTAHAGRGGRGGARGGRGGMNPSVSDFQPGSKRPRGGDSDAGAGAKRPRGAH